MKPPTAEDWSASPDLMSIDDKLTVVFGPMTADERKALDDLTKGLVVCTATYGRGRR